MNVSKTNTVNNNVVASKTEEKAVAKKTSTEGYEKKSAAPTDANLYKAMYNVQTKKAEPKKTETDDEKYERAMREHLQKWGTDKQIEEFEAGVKAKHEKAQAKTDSAKTADDEKYRKGMEEYLQKWGTDKQLNEFYGEKKYPVNKGETETATPSTTAKADKTENKDDKYEAAMRKYLETYGSAEQLKEFEDGVKAKHENEGKTETQTKEDNEYYRQYQEYKHKYE